MDIVEMTKQAGVVGAGGAGFPTHVKINAKADIVIANGAECEPLLRVDRAMMERFPGRIVEGVKLVMETTGAERAVICLKKHYEKAVLALEEKIKGEAGISLHLLESYYPAGDEQQMVYDVTKRVVPTGGIPLDVGAVVCNVTTLINIADAQSGRPVIMRYLTVTGEVEKPSTIKAPIGTSIVECIKAAGGPEDMSGYSVIIGGPAMGYIEKELSSPVTKTTGGIIVLPASHPHIRSKTSPVEADYHMAKVACSQCNYCTLMCPRNALGLKVEPHKAMRAVGYGGKGLGEANGIFSCCNCGICTYFACNFALKPSVIMTELKEGLMKKGIKPKKEVAQDVSANREYIKVPTSRLIARMGLKQYDVDAPLTDEALGPPKVVIPLKMHLGAPAKPVIEKGRSVKAGELIAKIEDGKLGANVHASIDGTVQEVTDKDIIITA